MSHNDSSMIFSVESNSCTKKIAGVNLSRPLCLPSDFMAHFQKEAILLMILFICRFILHA